MATKLKPVGWAVRRVNFAPGMENLMNFARRKKQTPETALKRAAVQLLNIHRIQTWPYPGGVMGTRGFPDRVGILSGGQFLAIEFKVNGRKLTEDQEIIRQQIERAGGKYIVCRSLDDLQRELKLPGLFV